MHEAVLLQLLLLTYASTIGLFGGACKEINQGKNVHFVWKNQGKVRENEFCKAVGTLLMSLETQQTELWIALLLLLNFCCLVCKC